MLESQSPRWCYSTEEYNGRLNNQLTTIDEKIFPDWFYSPYCDICEEYREFTNNVCPHQCTHIKSHYHVLFAKKIILILFVVMNTTVDVVIIVM